MPPSVPAVNSLPAEPAVAPKSPVAVPAPPKAACSAAARPTGNCASGTLGRIGLSESSLTGGTISGAMFLSWFTLARLLTTNSLLRLY